TAFTWQPMRQSNEKPRRRPSSAGGRWRTVYTMRRTMTPEQKFADRCDRVWRMILRKPGLSKAELLYATEGYGAIERNRIIDHLIAIGKIREERTPTRGPPKTIYWPAASTAPAASAVTKPVGRSEAGDFYAVTI